MEIGPIRLGWMSCLLLAFGLQALVHAAVLTQGSFNRRANGWLAVLLLVLAGMLTPFIIGYAGAYDAWPWLSFAPFAVPLALGPLILAYPHQPDRWGVRPPPPDPRRAAARLSERLFPAADGDEVRLEQRCR